MPKKKRSTGQQDCTPIHKVLKVSPEGDDRKNPRTKQGADVSARCLASEALLGIETLEDGKVRVILAEGWENVLPQKGEDDPGSLIMWDDDNIAATVTEFNAAIAALAAPPAWMNVVGGAPNPITIPGLKTSILTHVQATAGGGGVVGNALIAPNDLTQYSQVKSAFNNIGVEPFFMKHAQCPIGRHYVLADRRANTTAVADPILAPPVGLGVRVFA